MTDTTGQGMLPHEAAAILSQPDAFNAWLGPQEVDAEFLTRVFAAVGEVGLPGRSLEAIRASVLDLVWEERLRLIARLVEVSKT